MVIGKIGNLPVIGMCIFFEYVKAFGDAERLKIRLRLILSLRLRITLTFRLRYTLVLR